jgi:hypothetical protein
MAHHIFRRCLLADVVPPVPPPVLPGYEDRCDIGPEFFLAVDGVEFGASVGGLDVMGGFRIVPIPPGVETGDAPDLVWVADRYYGPTISFAGLDLWGGANEGGIQ